MLRLSPTWAEASDSTTQLWAVRLFPSYLWLWDKPWHIWELCITLWCVKNMRSCQLNPQLQQTQRRRTVAPWYECSSWRWQPTAPYLPLRYICPAFVLFLFLSRVQPAFLSSKPVSQPLSLSLHFRSNSFFFYAFLSNLSHANAAHGSGMACIQSTPSSINASCHL